MKNLKRVKIITFTIIVILLLIIVVFFLNKYLQSEMETYQLYDDFSRANIVEHLNLIKDFNSQYSEIRYQQRYKRDEPVTTGQLIYDFAQYEIVPILNYLATPEDNEDLNNAFSYILDFTGIYTVTQTDLAEDIFVKQSNGKYFVKKGEDYVYTVKKKIITKNQFNKLYYEYAKNSNILNYFINLLMQNEQIKRSFNANELKWQLTSNYNDFYKNYKNIILDVICNDLENFSSYLESLVIKPCEGMVLTGELLNTMDCSYKISKELDAEEITLNYTLRRVQKLYNQPTKYYKWLYVLDLDSVWNQLSELGYPKLYD